MKFYLTVLFATISFASVLGQQESFNDADTLIKRISEATTDTARILLRCKLSEAYRGNKPDTAFILATEALSKSTAIGFKKGEIHALIVLCVLYREKGDLPYALELGLKALKKSQEEKYAYEEIYSLLRIANVYFAVRDALKAIGYVKKADELLKNNYDDFQWAAAQYFLGDGYEQLNELDAAEKQVQILREKLGSDPDWIIIINRLRANIAVKRNKLPLAIEYYRESYSLAIATSDLREAATTSNAMALVFKKLGHPDSAIFYAKQGLKFGQRLAYKNRVLAASSLLAELYAESDPGEAVKYYQLASAAKDSLYGINKFQQLQSATMKEQERQTELEAARIAYQNKMRQYVLLTGAGVFLIIAIILFSNNRQKQKTNRLLETTLTNLKTTQSQLIHSEKMASLGELTAGIAHEIQNPLNFVNNFSEVNKEMIEEATEEIDKGNIAEVKNILNDINDNEEKINHHGKRADAIVKSMLQHSRKSSGKKEPTDINALCDEYLRLSYHGLRAKDKDFNADCKTDFDENVGKINVVPQDIGRVLLNLFNNAFYAVNEKKKLTANGYQPTAKVETRRIVDKVEIIISDNGNGIPSSIKEKIFQPFFTTKPTGEGTGLGLSLSYDIIKAHGGEIKVETLSAEAAAQAGKDREGTIFIIQLPA